MRAAALLLLALAAASPCAAQDQQARTPSFRVPLSERELAEVTGKFLLPNGVELSLSITSDTVLNGQAVLRTVLTIDQGQQLAVYGRNGSVAGETYRAPAASGSPAGAISVSIDRNSGLQTVVPVYAPAGNAATVNAPAQDAASLGLQPLAVAVGGPAVATADGTVLLEAVRGGTQVTLMGDQFGVAHLVGSSVATALTNSGNDRVFDNVTNVAVDLRGALPYQLGSAAMRVDTLALEATRGMVR